MIQIHPIKLGFVTSYLVESEKGSILIDAGYPKKENKLWKFLQKQEIGPTDIKLIIITHGHVDHVGGLKEMKEKTGAPVLIHESEGKLLQCGKSPGVHITIGWLRKLYPPDKETAVTPVEPDIMITDDFSLDEYGIDGKVIHTPGHTKGSITVIVDSKHAFVGDIAMKFPILSRSSYEPLIAEDLEQVYNSWRNIIDEGVETIYPAHGKIIGVEVLENLLNKHG
jgi:glyoxylase-like metal-dependent hydrolase (beta-lactamase superfamily II)